MMTPHLLFFLFNVAARGIEYVSPAAGKKKPPQLSSQGLLCLKVNAAVD
jgi:hypothetical protein